MKDCSLRTIKKNYKGKFREELKQKLGGICNYESSKSIFFEVLNKHALLKKEIYKTKSCPVYE